MIIAVDGFTMKVRKGRIMHDIIMRLKSGREFRFQCEEYTIETLELDGMLAEFSYKGGVGECPVYFRREDVECIAIIGKEQIEALKQVPSEDCVSRKEILKGYQSVCKDIACHECRAKDADGTCRLESFINNLPSADRPSCGARMESDGE